MSEADFRQKIEALLPDERKELGIRLRHQIDHTAKRIEYAESRRTFFLTTAGAFLAAGVAILGIALTKPVWLPLAFCLWALGISSLVFAITVWLVHTNHVNFGYPFTDVAKIPKWFYRYAIPAWEKYHFPWIRGVSVKERSEDKIKFDADYLSFLEASRTNLLDTSDTLLQDIKQIYLLHVNEMYKNRFLTSLRKTFERGLKVVFIASLIAFLIGLFFETQRWPAKDSRQQAGLNIQATWSPTHATASTSGNVNLQLSNTTNAPVIISGIIFRSSRGMTLPYELVQGDFVFPVRLEPGAIQNLAMLIDLHGNRLSEIKSVVIRQ